MEMWASVETCTLNTIVAIQEKCPDNGNKTRTLKCPTKLQTSSFLGSHLKEQTSVVITSSAANPWKNGQNKILADLGQNE